MVVDFGVLSELLKNYVHDTYDHGFIVYEGDESMREALDVGSDIDRTEKNEEPWKVIVVDWIPTAENIARAIFETLWQPVLEMHPHVEDGPRVSLFSIEVFETPKSSAIYIGGGA
jgi:6-pyruvoyltetrahydropterin/6-carboxytetrahydropterin synthase